MRTAVWGSRPLLWVLFHFVSTSYSPKHVVQCGISTVLNITEHNTIMSLISTKKHNQNMITVLISPESRYMETNQYLLHNLIRNSTLTHCAGQQCPVHVCSHKNSWILPQIMQIWSRTRHWRDTMSICKSKWATLETSPKAQPDVLVWVHVCRRYVHLNNFTVTAGQFTITAMVKWWRLQLMEGEDQWRWGWTRCRV